ncbi:MAG: hypothetical protein U0M51_04190 [Eggerthellaceae bacterium]
MKREDVKGIFPDATDEQIDRILNGIGAELNPLKASLADTTSRLNDAENRAQTLASAKTTLEAQLADANGKLQQGMSAEELLAAREKAAEEREREFTLKSNALEAKSIFVEAGFSPEQIESLLPNVVGTDLEATRAFAQSLVDIDKSRREAVEQSVKDELLKANPRLQGAGGDGAITKDAFDKLSFAEQAKLLEQAPGLLKTFENL